jgi:hypothetical protein
MSGKMGIIRGNSSKKSFALKIERKIPRKKMCEKLTRDAGKVQDFHSNFKGQLGKQKKPPSIH